MSLRTSEARRAEVASTRSEAQCAATQHRAAEGEHGAKTRIDYAELRSSRSLLLYTSPKTEAASRGAGQLIAKVVQWKGNGLTDNPKSFALATQSASLTAFHSAA